MPALSVTWKGTHSRKLAAALLLLTASFGPPSSSLGVVVACQACTEVRLGTALTVTLLVQNTRLGTAVLYIVQYVLGQSNLYTSLVIKIIPV